jgi:hypothetical protein
VEAIRVLVPVIGVAVFAKLPERATAPCSMYQIAASVPVTLEATEPDGITNKP